MTPAGIKLAMLVSDDPTQVRLIGAVVSRADWRLISTNDAESAISMLGTRDGMMLDAILLETKADATLVAELHSRRPALPIIAHAEDFEQAHSALLAGASDYLTKPATSENWLAALNLTAAQKVSGGELLPLSEKLSATLGFGEVVGSGPAFRAALAIAAKAARARIPILLEGEAGVGKDVVAAAIHAASPRDKRPFIVFDCASISPNLLESELFGHEKNAFTGAFERQIGMASLADTGTLFLDNIERLPLSAQVKLLQLNTHHEVQRLGSHLVERIDVRIIAASSGKLNEYVKADRFREDLYDQLKAINVVIPTLRERGGDVQPLVRHLLTRIAQLPNMREIGITDAAMELLSAYPWPGNVRQLQSTLLRAAIKCEGDALTVSDFPTIAAQTRYQAVPHQAQTGLAGGVTLFANDGHLRALNDIEADVIRLAIGHYRGRMAEVARRLGIGRSTLYRKLVELGITDVA